MLGYLDIDFTSYFDSKKSDLGYDRSNNFLEECWAIYYCIIDDSWYALMSLTKFYGCPILYQDLVWSQLLSYLRYFVIVLQ